jgi:tetratricopeptide (TPR) repeat protein
MIRLSCPAVVLLCAASVEAANGSHHERKAAGYAAFEVGRYTDAIGHFEAAYRLKRDPRLLYNLGLAYYRRAELTQEAADLRQARNLFRRFLALVPAGRRGADAKKVAAARRFASRYLREIDEALSVVGRPPTRTRPATTDTPTTPPPTVARPKAAPLLPLVPAVDEPPRKQKASSAHWWLYGLAGLAGTAAAITGGLALGADASSDDLAARGDPEANAVAGRSRHLAASTDVLLGVAVATAVVGAVLHYRARRAR